MEGFWSPMEVGEGCCEPLYITALGKTLGTYKGWWLSPTLDGFPSSGLTGLIFQFVRSKPDILIHKT